MLIGVPSEIKNHEYRVGLIPASAHELIQYGHQVLVQRGAGLGIGIRDEDYQNAGAQLAPDLETVYARADCVIKVKEPQLSECALLRRNQILFTFLHLAADKPQAQALMDSDCIALAYETVTDAQDHLPLLTPMSEVAGRMAIQAGAHCLEKAQGGRGVLLGGVPGVPPAEVVILGGGVVGSNALRMAIGMEAHVTVIDKSLARLQQLDAEFGASLNTIYATAYQIDAYVKQADLLVGAVLVPGAMAPKLVSRGQIAQMKPGSVIVDVAIDQGGCFETSRATTHADPSFVVDGIVHYCVSNMPGAAAHTSAFALNNATLPYILTLLEGDNPRQVLRHDQHLRAGLNVCEGQITHQAVAQSLDFPYQDPLQLLNP